jgi:[acyl-carrier-protein] S-malonyltransferase
VLHNVDVRSHADADAIRAALAAQLYSPVRWVETIRAMHAAGITRIAEFGPGKVLSGLNKRIEKAMSGIAIQTAVDLEKIISELA